MDKREKMIKNQQKMKYSNFFKKNISKIKSSSKVNIEDNNDNKDKKKEIPLFEQMVNNNKLIKLIHDYMNQKEEELEEEKEKYNKEKLNEDNRNEENINEDNKYKYKYNNENVYIDQEEGQIIRNKKKLDEIWKLEEQDMEEEIDKNKRIKRRKRKAKTYVLQKIELGLEIVKEICKELNINKDVKVNIDNCLFNLMLISRKEKKTEKENELQKKLMKPMNDITEKFLENMMIINKSREKPKGLFNPSVKSFLRDRLREILAIGEYNEDDLEEEEPQKSPIIHLKIQSKEEKTKKKKKELIYDNSYFFKKDKIDKTDKIKENLKIINIEVDEDDNDNTPNNVLKTSTSFEDIDVPKKTNIFKYFKKNKFMKTNNLSKLVQLSDEAEQKLETIEVKKKKEEIKLKNEDILDKRLQAFFEKILELKNLNNSKDEEKLRMFLDKEVERFDYTQEKVIEIRKYNFFNDLKVARISNKNGKISQNSKLSFHSPVIFNMYKK